MLPEEYEKFPCTSTSTTVMVQAQIYNNGVFFKLQELNRPFKIHQLSFSRKLHRWQNNTVLKIFESIVGFLEQAASKAVWISFWMFLFVFYGILNDYEWVSNEFLSLFSKAAFTWLWACLENPKCRQWTSFLFSFQSSFNSAIPYTGSGWGCQSLNRTRKTTSPPALMIQAD